MTFFWLFDLPNWELLIVLILFFVVFGIIGFLISERYVKRWLGHAPAANDIVSNFLTITGAFYGITLGLIAVATWNNYLKTENILFKEATLLETLYRNVSSLSPYDKELKNELKEMTRYIIYDGWPQQEKGIIPKGGSSEKFEQILFSISPKTEKENIFLSYILSIYNEMFEIKKERVNAINNGLPKELYWVLLIGAFISIATTWLLVAKRRSLHIITTALTGVLIGSLIFLIIAMDYPFLGEISISPEPYLSVYTNIMNK